MDRNPYDVLGVSRTADAEAIKKAYKTLARKYHPDVNKDPAASEEFKHVNAAYDVLGDPEKRKMYDRYGAASTRAGFDPRAHGWGGSPFGGGGGGDFSHTAGGMGFDDLLSSFFGGGAASSGRSQRVSRGRDQEITLIIEPMLAITGGPKRFSVMRPNGQTDHLTVRIPAGVRDGGKLRLRGQGLPPPGGGPCGDLHLNLSVPKHPLFKRVGDDLELEVPITILEAVKGASITVPTPTGSVKVTVPQNSQNGTRLRLRGRGVQKKSPGVLYLVLRPQLPPTAETVLAAAEQMEEAYTEDVRSSLTL